jgi:hypothetical protein
MNVSFNRFFLHNLIIAERWSSFSINNSKFLDEHRFEIKEIFNIESQNSTFEIFSIRYSNFNLILEWRLLQCLKFFMYLFLDLIVDFLVFNDSELQYFFNECKHQLRENVRFNWSANCFIYLEHSLSDFDDLLFFRLYFFTFAR